MKISDIGQRPANMPFTKAMALSILKADFNSFNEGLLGINNDTRRFILHHFPELKDSTDYEISHGLVMDEVDNLASELAKGSLFGVRVKS